MALAATAAQRPNIYEFHDYTEYLKAWLGYAKLVRRGYSLRTLAKEAGLSSGYLPMVLAGNRPLSGKMLDKILPFLDLDKTETAYLRDLVELGTSDSQEVRLRAISKLKTYDSYRKSNPKELEVYQYMTHWYYAAIRELAADPAFKDDPKWIQSRLRHKVPLSQIREALEFLFQHAFLEKSRDGSIRPPVKNLDCTGGVYRVALTQFHREMLGLAAYSIENTPSEERLMLGHVFAMDEDQIDQAKEVVRQAVEKLKELESQARQKNHLYHAELALFPLTRRSKS